MRDERNPDEYAGRGGDSAAPNRRTPEEIDAMLDEIFVCPPELADMPAWQVFMADRDGLVEMTLDQAKEWL